MINPIAGFYEWYLVFLSGLPISWLAFQNLVWGLTLLFALVGIYFRLK